MNKFILTGNIGSIKTQSLPSGTQLNVLAIAYTESRYNKADGTYSNETFWYNVKLFRETKLKKGDAILVEGRFYPYSYEKDGETKYGHDFIADRIELLHRPKTKQEEKPEPQVDPNTGLPF